MADELARRLYEAQNDALDDLFPHLRQIMADNHDSPPERLGWDDIPEEGRQLWRATVARAGLA